jgi:UDP-N-acetylmuramoylalanine--D-glutamate ligase
MKSKLLIIGAGESGTGAAILGKKKGFDVFVTDNRKIKRKYKNVLTEFEIPFEEEGHNSAFIKEATCVIKSPGIPMDIPLIRNFRQRNIPVIDELEFASRYTSAGIIAISGSNGKTTTSSLTYHILAEGGRKAGIAGNIGKSFAKSIALGSHDIYVLEVSSFQLDAIAEAFHPHIAILLNITPDHLDRYDHDFDKYVASKFRIVKNLSHDDYFIYNHDDPVIRKYLARHTIQARLIPFSIKVEFEQNGVFLKNKEIVIKINNKTSSMNIERLALQGRHNIYNSMAASVGGYLSEIRKSSIKESLSNFKNISHRLEFVARIFGVDYVNDSKATNVNSVWYAMETQTSDIIWIAGGVDKGNDYSKLQDLVRRKVRTIICLSKDCTRIYDEFHELVDEFYIAKTMEESVHIAHLIAEKDNVVLLSPACASFDLFENYEDRGNQFKKAVKGL